MSARAAWRLEGLGYGPIHRYHGAMADWSAAGLPLEGARVPRRLLDVLRRDVPRCAPNDRVAVARERATSAGWSDCAVVNDAGVLLGILRPRTLAGDAEALAEDAMDPGPVTYRPGDPADRTARRLAEKQVTRGLVTTTDGELVGMFFVADILGSAGA